MTSVTDDQMRERIAQAREYCVIILKTGPDRHKNGVETIIWEHARRNFTLRDEGVLPIVYPIADGSDVSGIGIFNAAIDRVREIIDDDPAVRAGIFVYEVHQCGCFAGDRLPV